VSLTRRCGFQLLELMIEQYTSMSNSSTTIACLSGECASKLISPRASSFGLSRRRTDDRVALEHIRFPCDVSVCKNV
jgi:hypothetical protein